MKQWIQLVILAVAGVGLCGCYSNSNGFGATQPGLIYAETTRGAYIAPKMQSMKDVEVLGNVKGSSSMTSVLCLFNTGDAGIAAAKADALRVYPKAEDIVNIEVDTKVSNVLYIMTTSTTVLTGKAVIYKK